MIWHNDTAHSSKKWLVLPGVALHRKEAGVGPVDADSSTWPVPKAGLVSASNVREGIGPSESPRRVVLTVS
jgi:hypothetical protein